MHICARSAITERVFLHWNETERKEHASMSMIELSRSDDVATIRNLSIETFTQTFAALNTPEDMDKYVADHLSPDVIRREIDDPDSTFLVATVDGAPAGYMKVNVGDAQTEKMTRDHMEVQRLYILKAFKRHGLGTGLMCASFDMVRAGKDADMARRMGAQRPGDRVLQAFRLHADRLPRLRARRGQADRSADGGGRAGTGVTGLWGLCAGTLTRGVRQQSDDMLGAENDTPEDNRRKDVQMTTRPMKTAALAGCGSSGPSSSWNAEQADSVWSEHVADAGTPLTADEFETTTCRRRGRIPPVTTNDCVTWSRGVLWAARTPDRLMPRALVCPLRRRGRDA